MSKRFGYKQRRCLRATIAGSRKYAAAVFALVSQRETNIILHNRLMDSEIALRKARAHIATLEAASVATPDPKD